MDNIDFEGAACPHCETDMEIVRHEVCSCHINPPCSSCVDSKVECPSCGFVPGEDVDGSK